MSRSGDVCLHRAPGTCCPEPICDYIGEKKCRAEGRVCDGCGQECRECRREA